VKKKVFARHVRLHALRLVHDKLAQCAVSPNGIHAEEVVTTGYGEMSCVRKKHERGTL
jgi:hypothetical protein